MKLTDEERQRRRDRMLEILARRRARISAAEDRADRRTAERVAATLVRAGEEWHEGIVPPPFHDLPSGE